MSGRSPVAIQMTRFSAPLPAEVKVFPELLRAQGYFAGVAGRTYHLDGPAGGRAAPELGKVFEKNDLRTFPKRLDYVKTSPAAEHQAARPVPRVPPTSQPGGQAIRAPALLQRSPSPAR